MSIETVTLLIITSFLILLLMGLPLAFITGSVAAIFSLILFGPHVFTLIVTRIFTLMCNYVLVAVPMFVFMACILEEAGVAEDLFNAVHVWAGPLRGGMAVGTIVACTIMAAMVGIIGAEVVTFGLIALPAMLRRGYKKSIALGSICAGGSVATLIPPSVVFIVYALTAGVSVGKLFIAGIFPGLLLSGLYISYILIRSFLQPDLAPAAPPEERAMPLRQKLRLLKGLILPAFLTVAVLGSIYAGIATPSEAAGVGCVGAMISAAVNRRFSRRMIKDALFQTMKTTCMLMWLFFGANAIIAVYTLAGGSQFVKNSIMGLPFGPYGIVIFMQVILIILGMFIDWIGIVLLTMPLFVPIITHLGFDPIWFGVVFCMNMQISYISPPFGPAVFYLKGVAPPDISVGEIFKSTIPFLFLQLIGLALVVAFPQIALWLPSKMLH